MSIEEAMNTLAASNIELAKSNVTLAEALDRRNDVTAKNIETYEQAIEAGNSGDVASKTEPAPEEDKKAAAAAKKKAAAEAKKKKAADEAEAIRAREAAEQAKEEEAQAETSEDAETPEDDGEVTLDDLRAKIKELMGVKKQKEAILYVKNDCGAAKLSDLEESDFPKVLAHFNSILEAAKAEG